MALRSEYHAEPSAPPPLRTGDRLLIDAASGQVHIIASAVTVNGVVTGRVVARKGDDIHVGQRVVFDQSLVVGSW